MANTLIWIIIVLAVLAGFAYLARWVITSFFPPPMQVVALIIVGVVLLIFLIIAASSLLGGGSPGFSFQTPPILRRP